MGALAPFVKVVGFHSSDQDRLQKLLDVADGVSLWGGDEAVASIRRMAAPGVRLIEWGHKLSFAYLTAGRFSHDPTLEGVATDCCRLDQQLCSSPQVVYLDTDRYQDLKTFALAGWSR